jgi:hypothetical protein
MNEQANKAPLNIYPFCPKGKTLSHIGHLNCTVLQTAETWDLTGHMLKVKPTLTDNAKTWTLIRRNKRKVGNGSKIF